jgi:hypothetical protein
MDISVVLNLGFAAVIIGLVFYAIYLKTRKTKMFKSTILPMKVGETLLYRAVAIHLDQNYPRTKFSYKG